MSNYINKIMKSRCRILSYTVVHFQSPLRRSDSTSGISFLSFFPPLNLIIIIIIYFIYLFLFYFFSFLLYLFCFCFFYHKISYSFLFHTLFPLMYIVYSYLQYKCITRIYNHKYLHFKKRSLKRLVGDRNILNRPAFLPSSREFGGRESLLVILELYPPLLLNKNYL